MPNLLYEIIQILLIQFKSCPLIIEKYILFFQLFNFYEQCHYYNNNKINQFKKQFINQIKNFILLKQQVRINMYQFNQYQQKRSSRGSNQIHYQYQSKYPYHQEDNKQKNRKGKRQSQSSQIKSNYSRINHANNQSNTIKNIPSDKYSSSNLPSNNLTQFARQNSSEGLYSQLFSQNSHLSVNQTHLIDRLLQLQISLVQKLNQIKHQKIQVLEQYNNEYDKYALLEIQVKKMKRQQKQSGNIQKKVSQNTKQINQKYIFNNAQQNLQINQANEQKLHRILRQAYELIQTNNYKQSLLNKQQLQQLEKLIKYEKYSVKNQLSNNKYHSQYIHDSDQLTVQNLKSVHLAQQLLVFDEYINILNKRVLELETQRKVKSSNQQESFNKVGYLIKKKIYLEQEIRRFQQEFKQMEVEYQRNRLYEELSGEREWRNYEEKVNKENGINRESTRRYQDIKRYQKLKKEFQQKQQFLNKIKENQQQIPFLKHNNKKDILTTNNSHPQKPSMIQTSRLTQKPKPKPLLKQSHISTISKNNVLLQQLRKIGEQQKLYESISQLEQEIYEIQQKIQQNVRYFKEEQQNKVLLYNEIQNKKEEFMRVKKENRIMEKLLVNVEKRVGVVK